MNPRVSFVVPCYRLAHLLKECVDSILAQTFGDLEVLIMDDCSPDDTPQIAKSFTDPRVRHIRNDPNLGHLRNYNKGIFLARGQFIWLISADDRLRRPYIVERYVDFMDRHPAAGFAFCPGMGLEDGNETSLLRYSYHGDKDQLFPGPQFFIKLLKSNSVLAASGMVRRDVYEKLGMFPLNMPFGGDWYLWLLFALHYDVAYLAEPMVHYRQHAQSMTNVLNEEDPRICTKDDLRVLWQIKRRAEEAQCMELASLVDDFIVDRATLFLASVRNNGPRPWYTFEDFEGSVIENAPSEEERRRIRSRVYSRVADEIFWLRNYSLSNELYQRSLKLQFFQPKVWLQWLLLQAGRPGIRLREAQLALRRWVADSKSH